jgi:hypothetical protein
VRVKGRVLVADVADFAADFADLSESCASQRACLVADFAADFADFSLKQTL